MPNVALVVGSKSDEPLIQETINTLTELGISYEVAVVSAHRNPRKTMDYAKSLSERDIEVVIAAAGGSAALPGVIASWTTIPVIGVPVPSSELKGVDSLHAIVQMPPGVPVACVAVGSWGARNAAYLAASILGLKYDPIRIAYEEYRERLASG